MTAFELGVAGFLDLWSNPTGQQPSGTSHWAGDCRRLHYSCSDSRYLWLPDWLSVQAAPALTCLSEVVGAVAPPVGIRCGTKQTTVLVPD